MEYKPLHIESNKNQHARGGRAGTPGASYDRTSYDRTKREQKSQEDREARLDRQRLRTNHLTPGQRWVPLLVVHKYNVNGIIHTDIRVLMSFSIHCLSFLLISFSAVLILSMFPSTVITLSLLKTGSTEYGNGENSSNLGCKDTRYINNRIDEAW